MKSARFVSVLGSGLLVAMAAAGCGSTPQGAASSSASSGQGPAQAASAPAAAKAPAWTGSDVWGSLAKLGNFSLESAIVVGGTGGGSSGGRMTFDEEYYSPTNYKVVIAPGGTSQPMTIILAGGHYYFATGSQVLDMGTSIQGMAGMYAAMGTGAWDGLYRSSSASYAGPCTVAGRAGNSFKLSTESALAMAAVGEKISGSACLDAVTGAPLATDLKWTMSVGGKTASFEDRLQITGIGNVPPIAAPAGAQPVGPTGSGGG